MKRFAFSLLWMVLVFGASFAAAKMFERKNLSSLRQRQSGPFRPASFALTNRPFAIVIVGHNNGAFVEKTLHSVFSQNYQNYRVLYIDDGSDDGSFEFASDLIGQSDRHSRAVFLRNERQIGTPGSLFKAVQSCSDSEIVVVLEGGDWLAHEWVLQRLNAYYDDSDLWLCIAQAIDFPTYRLPPPSNLAGDLPELCSARHLKTFYAALLKRLKESDFIAPGAFLPSCAELAYMVPMLQMGKHHLQFIPEVLAVFNEQAVDPGNRDLRCLPDGWAGPALPHAPLKNLEVNECGDSSF